MSLSIVSTQVTAERRSRLRDVGGEDDLIVRHRGLGGVVLHPAVSGLHDPTAGTGRVGHGVLGDASIRCLAFVAALALVGGLLLRCLRLEVLAAIGTPSTEGMDPTVHRK